MSVLAGDVGRADSPVKDQMRSRSVSVVIPIYNEEEILRDTVATVHAGLVALDLDFFEILLCENGSTDSTPRLAGELSREFSGVHVFIMDTPDYGAAMRAGFRAARGEVIVNFDADYYDLDFLDASLRVPADIVVAAKGVVGSNDTRVVTRRIVSRTFGWIVRSLLDLSVAETHGMKLFHKAAIESLVDEVESTKDLFDTELLARSEWKGLRIAELPIDTIELRHSRSGIVRRIPRTLWGLLRMRYRSRRAHAARVRVLPGMDPAAERSAA